MTNYKTTIVGIIAALIPVTKSVYDMMANGQPINWTLIGIGAAMAVMGYVAADAKKEETK